MRKITAALLAAALLALAGCARPDLAHVRVDGGALAGRAEDGVVVFKGIPFAAPPLGELRWRPPQPAAPWTGVRPALAFGPDCMQAVAPGMMRAFDTPPSEDCLYLNVWRPQSPRTKLPVIVWIYGGAYVNGGSSPDTFSGAQFARRGLVFVNFNYRLGRFGFFGFPALTAEHPEEPKGNYGHMDQIAALKWVRRNIAAFGGDPDNVTIFGESAGGDSVLALIGSPMSRGLFDKAIVQSGGGREPLMGLHLLSRDLPGALSAESAGAAFAGAHGIAGTDAAALAQLRALPADAVCDNLSMATLAQAAATYSGPVIDGRLVRETPQEAFRSGRIARVRIIAGATSDDLGSPTPAMNKDALFASFGPAQMRARAAYDPDGRADPAAVMKAAGRDRMMFEPARFVVASAAARGLAAYEYRFAYVARVMRPDWKDGAPHATDVPYVFDTVAQAYGKALSGKDRAMARTANAYWANFAKTGDPNGRGAPRWPRYSPAADRLLEFRAEGTVAAAPDPLKARLDAVAAAAAAR